MQAIAEREAETIAVKAEISLDHLQHALKVIAPAIPGASCSIPLLRSVRIEQLNEGLAIEASDLETSIRALIPETTQLTEAVCVPSERFIPWAKLLTGDSAKLSASSTRVTVKCGAPRVTIPRLQSSRRSAPSFASNSQHISYKQSDLLKILDLSKIAIGNDGSRPGMNGILFEADGQMFNAVATDGHRMAVYSRPSDQKFRFFLPEKLVRLLLPVLHDAQSSVSIQEEDKYLIVSVAADVPVFINCLKISAAFPNWKAIGKPKTCALVSVDSEHLGRAVERCLKMSDSLTRAIVMEFDSQEISVRSVDPNAGESLDTIDVTGGPDKQVRIGANGTYVAEVLKHLTGELEVHVPAAPNEPLILRSHPSESEIFDYYVMPMRIKE